MYAPITLAESPGRYTFVLPDNFAIQPNTRRVIRSNRYEHITGLFEIDVGAGVVGRRTVNPKRLAAGLVALVEFPFEQSVPVPRFIGVLPASLQFRTRCC